jgi:hypothetical protein
MRVAMAKAMALPVALFAPAITGCALASQRGALLGEHELGYVNTWAVQCRSEQAGVLRTLQWRVYLRDLVTGEAREVMLVREAIWGGPGAPQLNGTRLTDEQRSYEVCLEEHVVYINNYPTHVLLR